MDVDVPQPGQQVGAAEVDDVAAPRIRRAAAVEHFHDAAAVDDDTGAGNRSRGDAVDHGGIGQDASHHHGRSRASEAEGPYHPHSLGGSLHALLPDWYDSD